jgi:dsRNA-specific ribonuclease
VGQKLTEPVDGIEYGTGKGRTKASAKEIAAKLALDALQDEYYRRRT